MNWIESKLARLKIKGRWYNYYRREMMIERASGYHQEATWHFKDPQPGKFLYYAGMETMFRNRAAWYLKKMREKGQVPSGI